MTNSEIIIPKNDDVIRFPKYTGKIGVQPDGSCILSPRMWSHLRYAMACDRDPRGLRQMSFLHEFQEFVDAYSEETGLDLETFT